MKLVFTLLQTSDVNFLDNALHVAARKLRCLLLISTAAILLQPSFSTAATLHGEVVSLSDGDTLIVLDDDKRQHKVRLSGIDAPERSQPFGDRSRQNLASMVFQKRVAVDWEKHDRYGRIVGKVLIGKADICLEQIRAGLAWHYKKYEYEQGESDRLSYAKAEVQARSKRQGLWTDPSPTPPWEYRRSRRKQ